MERVNTLMLQTTALYIQYVLLQAIFGGSNLLLCSYSISSRYYFSNFTITIHPVCFYESACLCQSHESQKPALRNYLFFFVAFFSQILNKSKINVYLSREDEQEGKAKQRLHLSLGEGLCEFPGKKVWGKKRRQDHGRVREEWRKIGTVRAMGTKCLCVSCLNTTFPTLHIQRRNICL